MACPHPGFFVDQLVRQFLNCWHYGLEPALSLITDSCGAISLSFNVSSRPTSMELSKNYGRRRHHKSGRSSRRRRQKVRSQCINQNTANDDGQHEDISLPTLKSLPQANNSSSNDNVEVELMNVPMLLQDPFLCAMPNPSHDYSTSTEDFTCENCGVEFKSRNALQDHDTNFEYGCDICSLCFESNFDAELHNLEWHPKSTQPVMNNLVSSSVIGPLLAGPYL